MLSHCRLVAMSHCRIAAMSYCRFVAMSHCCIAAMSHCRIVALSQCRNDALSSVATVENFPQPQLFAQENSKHGELRNLFYRGVEELSIIMARQKMRKTVSHCTKELSFESHQESISPISK